MPRRLPLVLLAIVVLLGLPAFAEFYTDWLWFRELGYEQVFIRSLTARSTITAVVGVRRVRRPRRQPRHCVSGAAAVAVHGRHHRRTAADHDGPDAIPAARDDGGGAAGLVRRALRRVAVGHLALRTSTRRRSGLADPILGRDVGFYVFTLPLLELVRTLLLVTVFVAAAGSLAAYVLGGEVGLDPIRGIMASRAAVRHLSILAAVLLLVLAFGAWLQIPQMLTTGSGAVYGASYTDVHARIPALRVLVLASLIGAALALWQIRTARFWPVAAAAALYFVVSLGGVAYAAIIQRFVVGAERAGARDAVHHPQHPGHARGVRARPRGGARAVGRGASHSQPTSIATRRPSTTCRSGTTGRCSTRSDSCRRSGPTTTSSRWTTTGTRSTGNTVRSCCRRAS